MSKNFCFNKMSPIKNVESYGADENTKAILFSYKGFLYHCYDKKPCDDGFSFGTVDMVCPDIEDITVANDSFNRPVVAVYFKDTTKETAVLADSDTFDLDTGIGICIIKKVFDCATNGNGSSLYNKLIQRGLKKYNMLQAEAVKRAKEEEEEEAKRKRVVEKKLKKAKKRLQKKADLKDSFDYMVESLLRLVKEIKKMEGV